MHYRELGRTGWKISDISFGAWAIGGSWGTVDDRESLAALHKAIDCGVKFIDTADVYGMGRSERLIAQLKRERGEEIQRRGGLGPGARRAGGLWRERLTQSPNPPPDNPRQFNRHGEAFDVGETFSGVDYASGLEAVEEIRGVLPPGVTMPQFALRW